MARFRLTLKKRGRRLSPGRLAPERPQISSAIMWALPTADSRTFLQRSNGSQLPAPETILINPPEPAYALALPRPCGARCSLKGLGGSKAGKSDSITGSRIIPSEDMPNFRCWLQADIQPPENDVCSTPNNGHSEAHAGLPVLNIPLEIGRGNLRIFLVRDRSSRVALD